MTDGIETDVRAIQSLNASELIVVADDISTDSKDVQNPNALSPIVVTDEGISI